MTMPEILRRKLMERIDIASEPDDGEGDSRSGISRNRIDPSDFYRAWWACRRNTVSSDRRSGYSMENAVLEAAGQLEAGGCDSADCRLVQPRGE